MSGNSLKALYEKIPTGVKSALSPLFIRMMVDNPEFKRTYSEIERFEALDAAGREAVQLTKLKEVLVYAGEHVPYYRNLFAEAGFDPSGFTSLDQLEQLPFLEKPDAVRAGDSLYSDEGSLSYFETFTGGSSGQALRVLLDRDSVYRERAFACHSYAKRGFDIRRSRTAAFWGHNKQQDYYYSPLKNEIVISPFRLYREQSAAGIVSDIERFGATFLAGYPSAIFQLVKMMEAEGLALPVEHVFYYAENYEPEKRDFVDSYLGCSSSSDYGHTEHAVKAEVGDDFVEFNGLYGYTELVPTDVEDEYRIVCTGFTSRKMPLIRYATDDVVKVGPDGSRRLVGHKRSDVCLIGKNGVRIFKGAMTLHVAEMGGVTAYQYRQTQPGKATLCVVAPSGLSAEEERSITAYVERRVEGLLDVSIEVVDELETTARGKALWAVVDLPGGGLLNAALLVANLHGPIHRLPEVRRAA